jgi:hypothetical protein
MSISKKMERYANSDYIELQKLNERLSEELHPYMKHLRKIVDYNGMESLIVTLSMGLIVCMRSCDTLEDRQYYYMALYSQYIQQLKKYNYKSKDYSPWCIMFKKNPPISVERFLEDMPTDYYDIQRKTTEMFGYRFHKYYNNYLTFIIYCFKKTGGDMSRFINELVHFYKEDKICIYDNPRENVVYRIVLNV